MTITPSEEVATIANMVAAIGKVLAGHAPALQSAALADCLALWLAGHHVPGNKDATRDWRKEMLGRHCTLVMQLVPEKRQADRNRAVTPDLWLDVVFLCAGLLVGWAGCAACKWWSGA